MPQMYPMNWMFLFFMFLMLMFMINFLNYFYLFPKPNYKNFFYKNKKSINWLW